MLVSLAFLHEGKDLVLPEWHIVGAHESLLNDRGESSITTRFHGTRLPASSARAILAPAARPSWDPGIWSGGCRGAAGPVIPPAPLLPNSALTASGGT